MMTLGSLFDGIGGFPLAAVHCGGVPVWASEIEPFPMRVTKLRFPDMIHVGDITKLDGAKLPPVDVICGGSPCQDLSVAGLRKGLAGERSGLFMDQVRIVKEMRAEDERRGVSDDFIRPRYLVWENVPGAFSSANGEDFRAVIEEIVHIKDSTCHVPRPDTGRWESAGAAILGDQFSLAWRVLDAQYWGVAQRRRRIFLVADFGGLTAPKILFEQERLPGDPAEGQDQGKGVTAAAGNSSADSGGSRVAEEKQVDIFAVHIDQREETINLNGISGALMATTNLQMQTFVAGGMRKFESAEKEECLCLNDQGGERMDVSVDVTATLRAGMSGHPPLVMGIQQGSAGAEETPDLALTEEAETGGTITRFCLRITGLMPDIQVRMRWPLPCQPGMEQEETMSHWFQICRRVIVLPEISLIGKYKMEEMVWDASRIYPILLRAQTVMQCSAAREVMNFCKIG